MCYGQIYKIAVLTAIGISALHADPLFYFKNDSDRTVLLGITENNGHTTFVEALAPKKEYTMDRSHDSQQIVALSIVYCPDKKGAGCNALDANGNVSTETENMLATQGETANFKFENTAEVRRWYLKLKIEKNGTVFIAPQEGRLGKTSNLKYSLSGNIKKDQIKSARNAPVAKPQASKAPTTQMATPPPPADLPPALPTSVSSARKSSAARPETSAQTPQSSTTALKGDLEDDLNVLIIQGKHLIADIENYIKNPSTSRFTMEQLTFRDKELQESMNQISKKQKIDAYTPNTAEQKLIAEYFDTIRAPLNNRLLNDARKALKNKITTQNPLIKKYLDKRYSFANLEKYHLKLQSKGYTGSFIDPKDYPKDLPARSKGQLIALLTEASQKIKQSNNLETTLYTIAFPAYYKAKMIFDILQNSKASTTIINDAQQALVAFLEEKIDNKKGYQPMIVEYLDDLETDSM